MLNNIDFKFIKFLLVGGLNTIFGYGAFALLIYLNLHYTLAALISTVLGIMFNFKTTGVIVFNNNENRLFFRFIGVYFISYIFSVMFLRICLLLGSYNMYLNSVILILPNSILTYKLMKTFVFKSCEPF